MSKPKKAPAVAVVGGLSEKARPLNDRVLVRPRRVEEKTSGGIVVPDAHSERPLEAIVLKVGKGRILESGQQIPVDVKVGDLIYFGKFTGEEVKVAGETLLMLREGEILMADSEWR